MDFIHLHNHSDYSVLDGAITLDRLIARAKEMGMPGVAVTDHGNLFGAVEFYQKAINNGIKPVIGQELLHLLLALRFVDAEHVGAAFGGAQRDQDTGIFLLLQSGQVLIPVRGALL